MGIGEHLSDAIKFGGIEVFAFDNQDPEEGCGAGVNGAIDGDDVESATDMSVVVLDIDALDVFFDPQFDSALNDPPSPLKKGGTGFKVPLFKGDLGGS